MGMMRAWGGKRSRVAATAGASGKSSPQSSVGRVRGHEGGFVLVATHDDLEEMLAGMFGQLREPHVIDDDEQIGLEGTGEGFVPLLQGLLLTEVGDDIKGGAVARHAALLDGFVADNVGERRGTHAGRNEEEPLGAFAREVTGRQLVDVLPRSDAVRPPRQIPPTF